MKLILVVLTVLFLLAGCKKKADEISTLVYLSKPKMDHKVQSLWDTIIIGHIDSIYVFVKNENQSVRFMLGYDTVPAFISGKNFPVFCSGPINNKDSLYKFACNQIGLYDLNVIATPRIDIYSGSLHFNCVNNLAPIGYYVASSSTVNDTIKINVDASGSYDPDKRYGGGIVLYEYNITNVRFGINKTIQSIQSKQVFPVDSAGDYTVSLRVEDNDQTWSTLRNSFLTVNK